MLSNEIIDRTRQIRGFKANNHLCSYYFETLNNLSLLNLASIILIGDRTHDNEVYQADFLSPVQ